MHNIFSLMGKDSVLIQPNDASECTPFSHVLRNITFCDYNSGKTLFIVANSNTILLFISKLFQKSDHWCYAIS